MELGYRDFQEMSPLERTLLPREDRGRKLYRAGAAGAGLFGALALIGVSVSRRVRSWNSYDEYSGHGCEWQHGQFMTTARLRRTACDSRHQCPRCRQRRHATHNAALTAARA